MDEQEFHKQIEEATERCRRSEPRPRTAPPLSLRAQARAILAEAKTGKPWTLDYAPQSTVEERRQRTRLWKAIRHTAYTDQALAPDQPRYRVSIRPRWNDGPTPTITMVVTTYPTNEG